MSTPEADYTALVEALRLVALDSREQATTLGPPRDDGTLDAEYHATELRDAVDEAFDRAQALLEIGRLTTDQYAPTVRLSVYMDAMVDQDDSTGVELFCDAAVADAPQWEEDRVLARAALDALGEK